MHSSNATLHYLLTRSISGYFIGFPVKRAAPMLARTLAQLLQKHTAKPAALSIAVLGIPVVLICGGGLCSGRNIPCPVRSCPGPCTCREARSEGHAEKSAAITINGKITIRSVCFLFRFERVLYSERQDV